MTRWWMLLLLLVGCVPTTSPNLRPAGSPDVVVIGFAGRCASIPLVGDGCTPPFDNYGYLDDDFFPRSATERQTAQVVLQTFRELGQTVEYFDVSAFIEGHRSGISRQIENGYLEAEGYLKRVVELWVKDYQNPTRIVILAHSHGTVWASLLAWNHPEVKFDYFIYLDGICSVWDSDNLRNHPLVQGYYDPRGLRRPFPLNPGEGETPCDVLSVPGLRAKQDINDVVPWNVKVGLEVVSRDPPTLPSPNWLYDDDPNYRPDGTRISISSFKSVREDHSGVTAKSSEAMRWVVAQLKERESKNAVR